MYRSYQEMIDKAKNFGPVTMAVAVAQDEDVLGAVKLAKEEKLANSILVGDRVQILSLLEQEGLEKDFAIVHEPDEQKASLAAVKLVHDNEAQVLIKGLINTSDFLRSVLHPEFGLRTGRLLSHLAAMEIPGEKKIVFHADTGMVVAPTLEEKKEILINSLLALKAMGIFEPKVAIVTANEKVSPKMPATTDAQELVRMREQGVFSPCVMEGPIAMDVALNPDAARHKGIDSRISGDVDLFIVPNIEAGNIAGKAMVYYAKARMAGLILGATHPIVLTSRAETARGKLNSIALACLMAGRNETQNQTRR